MPALAIVVSGRGREIMEHEASHRRLILVLAVTAVIFLVQLVGALFSGSLSLLSNAGHLFTDIGSIGVALYAAKIQNHDPTEQLTYGFGRSGTVAAFVNGLVLAAIGLALIITSVFRLVHPSRVNVSIMIVVTMAALALNIVQVVIVRTHDAEDLNRQSVYWHALGDSLSSLGILLAAVLIQLTGWFGWDPTAALVVGLIILWSSYKVGRPSLLTLMEAVPEAHNMQQIEATMRLNPTVEDVHHIHVWSLAPGYHALSAHVRVHSESIREGQAVITTITETLRETHGIHHVTIQLEADSHEQDDKR